ncbi:MAG: hypothetical protein ABIP63_06195 [Thermoanaerobaculia bacterium]
MRGIVRNGPGVSACVAYDPGSNTRAAVLAASLSLEPPAIVPLALPVPAIRRVVARQKPPLHLDAAIHRYRIERIDPDEVGSGFSTRGDEPFIARLDAEHRVVVIDEPAGGRFCRTAERRHRR